MKHPYCFWCLHCLCYLTSKPLGKCCCFQNSAFSIFPHVLPSFCVTALLFPSRTHCSSEFFFVLFCFVLFCFALLCFALLYTLNILCDSLCTLKIFLYCKILLFYYCHQDDCHEAFKCLTELCGDLVHQISPRSVRKYGKY